jgi:hypothetical protein
MKSHSRVFFLVLAVITLGVGAITFGVTHDSRAQRTTEPFRLVSFDKALKGSYSFTLHGFIGKSSCKPFGVSGVLQFDGSGKVTGGSMTMRIQDQKPWSITIQQPSTYTIKSDGAGAMNISFLSSVSGKGRWELSIAVAKNGDRVFLNLTKAIYDIGLAETPDEGDAATGEAVPQ